VEKEIDKHTNTDTHRLKERERKTELQMNKRDGEESVCVYESQLEEKDKEKGG